MFISVTRLRIRKWYYLPEFIFRAIRSNSQAKRSSGFVEGYTLNERSLIFWTVTAWQSEADMKAFRGAGPHRDAMPKLAGWCDEAVVAHYQGDRLPDPLEAWECLKTRGRSTPVNHPSANQVEKRISEPVATPRTI